MEVAHAAGVPVVIDMSQSVGHVPTVTGADIVYGTSRKWLTGPRGIGFIAVRRDSLREVEIPDSDAFIADASACTNAIRELLAVGQQRVFRELATVGRVTRERLNGIGSWEVLEAGDEPSALVTLAPPPAGRPPTSAQPPRQAQSHRHSRHRSRLLARTTGHRAVGAARQPPPRRPP